MNQTDLYDLAPLGRMLLLAAVLASGPLAWVWLRTRGASLQRRLAWLTGLVLFLTFDLVLFGAFTRLTDSGLGCPDWPGCYGHASPLGAHADISAAQAALPSGPVTLSKAWVEMIHRYLATGVGVLILVLALVSTVERQRLPRRWVWGWFSLLWVCLQGAFGALTVTMKLFPAIVTLHLLGGMGLLALLRVQGVRMGLGQHHADWQHLGAGVRLGLWGLYVLVWCQIALGGWVSTNYAVLACGEFPTCQGVWWPEMDFVRGFEWWRGLGVQASGEALPFAALTAIHFVHRAMAMLVLTAMACVAWCLYRLGLRRAAITLVLLALWQLLSGLSNVVLDWPLVAALAHTGGAAAMVVTLTGWLAHSIHHSRTAYGLSGITAQQIA